MKHLGLIIAALAFTVGGCVMPCRSSCDTPGLYQAPKPRYFGTETVCATSGTCKPKAYPTFAKYWPFLDDLHTTWTAKSCAKKILWRQQWKARRRMGSDYKAGFTQAFVDIAHGGSGEIPAVPPPRFWNTQFRSPWGQQKAERWFDGYRAGAAMGGVELNAMRQVAASADWTIQKPKSPFAAQSCAPGGCPPGNCATGNCDPGLNGGSLLNPEPPLPFRSTLGPGPGCASGCQTCPQQGPGVLGPPLGPVLNSPPHGFAPPQFPSGGVGGNEQLGRSSLQPNGPSRSPNNSRPMNNAAPRNIPLNLLAPRNTPAQPAPKSGNVGPGHSGAGVPNIPIPNISGARQSGLGPLGPGHSATGPSGGGGNRPALQPGHSAPQIPGASPRDGIVY